MGLALGAHKPAKISQHKVNFSPYRPIAACGLGGDREALRVAAANLTNRDKPDLTIMDVTMSRSWFLTVDIMKRKGPR